MAKPTKWPVHPAKTRISLGIRPVSSVFAVCMRKPRVLSYPLSAQRRLISLGGCPGWSESSLDAQVICWFLSCGGSNQTSFEIFGSKCKDCTIRNKILYAYYKMHQCYYYTAMKKKKKKSMTSKLRQNSAVIFFINRQNNSNKIISTILMFYPRNWVYKYFTRILNSWILAKIPHPVTLSWHYIDRSLPCTCMSDCKKSRQYHFTTGMSRPSSNLWPSVPRSRYYQLSYRVVFWSESKTTYSQFCCTYDLPHDKTNKITYVDSKDSNQTGRIAWAFAQSDQSLCCQHEESLGA